MKKIAVASLSVLAVAGQAFAATDAPSQNLAQEQLTKPSADLDPAQVQRVTEILDSASKSGTSVDVYGVVQANFNLADTQRKNVPDFNGEKVRLGVFIDGGIATGQVEIDLENSDGTVDLRQAQMNITPITVKHMGNEYITTVALGGIRVGGATAIAPDAASIPTDFGRQDGIYLTQDLNFGKKFALKVGLGAFNQLNVIDLPATLANGYTNWTDLSTAPVGNFTGNSANGNLAYMGTLAADVNLDRHQSLSFAGFYGMQSEAQTSETATKPGATSVARDVAHAEASLVYNNTPIFGQGGVISGNGIGLWYELEDIGGSMQGTSDGGNTFTYDDKADDGYTASLIGLGVAGDTGAYMTNMIQRGDRLTYAAAFTYSSFSFDENFGGATTAPEDINISQVAVSFGYAVSTFEVALNAEFSQANEDFFLDTDGKATEDESRVYLTAMYAF